MMSEDVIFQRMRALWARLEGWMASRDAGSLRLRAPASEGEIAAAEAVIGRRLPAAFRASLAIHDGQESDYEVEWLPTRGCLAPLSEVVAQWQYARGWDDDSFYDALDDADRVRCLVSHPGRVVVGNSIYFDGDGLVLDLIPGPAGVEGQVLAFVTECDMVTVGSGFDDFMARLVALLDRDLLTVAAGDDYGRRSVLVSKSEKAPQHRWEGALRQVTL
jgi:cell wall assembly regulator SMI1